MDCSPPGSRPWGSPGQNAGVGDHSLLQGIVPTQGLNRGLLHCKRVLHPLSHQGNALISTNTYLTTTTSWPETGTGTTSHKLRGDRERGHGCRYRKPRQQRPDAAGASPAQPPRLRPGSSTCWPPARAGHRPNLSCLTGRTGRRPATARHGEPGAQAQGSLAETGRVAALGPPAPATGQRAAAGVGADTPTG